MPDKRLKILFTIPNFITAGSGKALWNIVQRLDKSRFDPFICVLKKGGDLESEIEDGGITVLEHSFTIRAKPYLSLYKRAKNEATFFKSFQFDIWHSFHYSDDYTEALIAKMAGAKWIYTKKNMNWNTNAWKVRSWLAKTIIAQNPAAQNGFFSSPVYRRKCQLIRRGVDTESYRPKEISRSELQTRYRLDHNRVLIGNLAQIIPLKGQEYLIRAMESLPDAHLFLAGKPLDEQYLSFLENLAGELKVNNRVTFVGQVEDPAHFLNQMDIYAHSSLRESCPVSLLEALACGKPCVSTDTAGGKDILGGLDPAYIVPVKDSAAMEKALRKLINCDDLKGHGARARNYCLSRFVIEKEVESHSRLYLQLAG